MHYKDELILLLLHPDKFKSLFIATASAFHISYSVSINTSSPPSYMFGLTLSSSVISEKNIFLPTNTPCSTLSIPYTSIPATFIDRCKDAVPVDNAKLQ